MAATLLKNDVMIKVIMIMLMKLRICFSWAGCPAQASATAPAARQDVTHMLPLVLLREPVRDNMLCC